MITDDCTDAWLAVRKNRTTCHLHRTHRQAKGRIEEEDNERRKTNEENCTITFLNDFAQTINFRCLLRSNAFDSIYLSLSLKHLVFKWANANISLSSLFYLLVHFSIGAFCAKRQIWRRNNQVRKSELPFVNIA